MKSRQLGRVAPQEGTGPFGFLIVKGHQLDLWHQGQRLTVAQGVRVVHADLRQADPQLASPLACTNGILVPRKT